ncbi:MAG: 30S ribosomal protein S13 [Patescibacteria group bacterium]|nr:30S ribosomal protein S13 [Patescibacteria group bacterium]
MARIAGVEIPREKRVEASLPYIYGIGLSASKKILAKVGINPNTRVKDLKEEELSKIREEVEKKYVVEGALRHEISLNVKRLKDTLSYRGLRHIRNLPVRGQRTKTNARTKRGRRSVIGGTKRSGA